MKVMVTISMIFSLALSTASATAESPFAALRFGYRCIQPDKWPGMCATARTCAFVCRASVRGSAATCGSSTERNKN